VDEKIEISGQRVDQSENRCAFLSGRNEITDFGLLLLDHFLDSYLVTSY
jgi:hypothetical protein